MPVSKQGETKADPDFGPVSHLTRWAEAIKDGTRAAPVERWHPPSCGAIDIRIDRGGAWHHEGRRIDREALVKLFARVLRREADGSYVLVTPAEKLTIRVDDAPFLAVDLDVEPGPPRLLRFLTNLGEVVPLDAVHSLRIADTDDDAFVPYVTVRPGIEARLTRALAESLAHLAEVRDGAVGIESGGHFFVIGRVAAMDRLP